MSGILGEILRAGAAAVPAIHAGTVRALQRCGTGELGYTIHACTDCRESETVPRSCGNRHCPRCQGRLARAWLERQQTALLATPYFHGVAAPRELYALLFEAAAQTLLQLGRERLGGILGVTAVLHTWGQRLTLHPHLHAIVTGGALDRWHGVKSPRYLFPVGVMSALFRGKFLAGLTTLKEKDAVPTPTGGWPKLWKALGEAKHWVVYAKPPFAGPESVLAYLANYTHRVAISERRIEAFDKKARTVTYRWRDYRVKGSAHATDYTADGTARHTPCGAPDADPASADPAMKRETIPVEEFVKRFCRHLLPRSFTKIRHYGLLANHARHCEIPRARAAIARLRRRTKPAPLPPPAPWQPQCAHCGGVKLVCIAVVRPDGRTLVQSALARLTQPICRVPP
jgi:hypothetical protein